MRLYRRLDFKLENLNVRKPFSPTYSSSDYKFLLTTARYPIFLGHFVSVDKGLGTLQVPFVILTVVLTLISGSGRSVASKPRR